MTDDPRDPLEDRLRAEAEHAGCGYHRDLYREAADAIDELRARLDAAAAAVDRAAVRDPVADLNRLMVDVYAMYEQWREHVAQAVEAYPAVFDDGARWLIPRDSAARTVRRTPFPAHSHRGVPGIDPAATADGAQHQPFTDDGVTYCGWDGKDGCGEVWPCSHADGEA